MAQIIILKHNLNAFFSLEGLGGLSATNFSLLQAQLSLGSFSLLVNNQISRGISIRGNYRRGGELFG